MDGDEGEDEPVDSVVVGEEFHLFHPSFFWVLDFFIVLVFDAGEALEADVYAGSATLDDVDDSDDIAVGCVVLAVVAEVTVSVCFHCSSGDGYFAESGGCAFACWTCGHWFSFLEPAVSFGHPCPLVFHFVWAFSAPVDGESSYEIIVEELFDSFHSGVSPRHQLSSSSVLRISLWSSVISLSRSAISALSFWRYCFNWR